MFINGNTLYISNVGDSRAIIGVQEGARIVGKPLSCDQTPYRKDERERVKKYGARILSMDQIEGIEPVHENWGDVKLGTFGTSVFPLPAVRTRLTHACLIGNREQ